MKKIVLLLVAVLISGVTEAQWICSKFRVNFTDKANSPYSVSNPSAFLSARAIARRTAQNIAVVQNDIPVNSWYIDSVRNTGVSILNPSKWFNSVTIFTVDSSAISRILAFPFVSSIDSLGETPVKKGAKRLPKNPDTMKDGLMFMGTIGQPAGQQSVQNTTSGQVVSYDYGLAYTQAHQLATDYLHDLGYRGEGMVIAVLDAGFYNVNSIQIFDSLFAGNQILGTRDFVTPGGNVYTAGTHGMMVLSTMGGNVPGQMIGTAPKASYWLLRTEDGSSEFPIEEDNWVSGAEFADSVGADLINSSLGYTTFDNPDWSHIYADMNGQVSRASLAATIAASKGMIVVNSAGNSGDDPWYYIGAPADADSILAVGAVDGYGVIASFSSRGPSFDGRVKPDVCAMGLNSIVSSSSGIPNPGNGTSFASPILAGSVACLWQANPGMTNMEIIEVVRQSANRYTTPDTVYGYGIPNMAAANMILGQKKIHNFDLENQINIGPNPFTDYLTLMFYSTGNDPFSFELFDTSGKSVYRVDKMKREVGYNYYALKDLGNIPAGVYILKVISGNLNYSNKLVKSER